MEEVMTGNYTPGPWRADQINCVWSVDSCSYIADCHPGHRSDSENEANARLIAAAPDLLEALHLVVGSLDFDREDDASKEVMRRVKTAIAKAEGRA